ncbi:MAG TPA: BON domain-containing protein [Opitutaceae bacterium]|nr:BON domain-containing protein [Opitutaceae bacterium]
MKKLVTSLLAVAALSSTPLLLTSGCAGNSTKESTGEYVDDTAVTAKVKTELIRDPVVKARQVDVTTFKGTVQLSGFVDTPEQKERAAELARGVQGVQDVKNNIVVKASTTP